MQLARCMSLSRPPLSALHVAELGTPRKPSHVHQQQRVVMRIRGHAQPDAVSTKVADASDSAYHAQPAHGTKTWTESVRCAALD